MNGAKLLVANVFISLNLLGPYISCGVPEGSRVQYVIRILMSVPSTFTTVPTDEPRASTLLVDTFADAPLDSSIRRVCALVSEPIRLQHYLLS